VDPSARSFFSDRREKFEKLSNNEKIMAIKFPRKEEKITMLWKKLQINPKA